MTEIRKSVLRTVRLDDDVWAAVKGMDCSLNQFLRSVLLEPDSYNPEPLTVPKLNKLNLTTKREPLPMYSDPREVPGIIVGTSSKNCPVQIPSECIHNAPHPQGRNFMAERKNATLCQDCFLEGHRGEPRNCSQCALGEGTGGL